jgi:hypothetical protein
MTMPSSSRGRTRPRPPSRTDPHRRTDPPRATSWWLSTDVRLIREGTAVFNDVYPADEPFEPLAVFLPKDTAAA